MEIQCCEILIDNHLSSLFPNAFSSMSTVRTWRHCTSTFLSLCCPLSTAGRLDLFRILSIIGRRRSSSIGIISLKMRRNTEQRSENAPESHKTQKVYSELTVLLGNWKWISLIVG